ncbi:MAG TPA: glutaredoxin family protein [Candidatus Paceibacterota bacterium]
MNIIIYTKTGCRWCKDALQYLKKENISFEEREVLGNKVFFEELVTKSGQTKTPTLDIDGYILADSDADEIAAYLQSKRAIL